MIEPDILAANSTLAPHLDLYPSPFSRQCCIARGATAGCTTGEHRVGGRPCAAKHWRPQGPVPGPRQRAPHYSLPSSRLLSAQREASSARSAAVLLRAHQ